jgi:hypothetical protein
VKAFSEDTAKRLENFGFIQSRPGGSVYPITHAKFYVLDACNLAFSCSTTLFYHDVIFFMILSGFGVVLYAITHTVASLLCEL